MTLDPKWLVDLSHLMLAVATASNVTILAAQDLSFRAALLKDMKRIITTYRVVGEHSDQDNRFQVTRIISLFIFPL